jgi:hypothetical protein
VLPGALLLSAASVDGYNGKQDYRTGMQEEIHTCERRHAIASPRVSFSHHVNEMESRLAVE